MTIPDEPPTPRAFLSYSWSSPQHELWVLELARRLVEDGVDVKFDKWDLKPGHDSYQFMELMVTDPTITKVLMICDKVYRAKADARSGGVGSESQIISPELYKKGAQDKFAALVSEADDDGTLCVPVFYKSRIYFDFTRTDSFEEAYEQLLRWLVDRPRHVKPKLGKIPDQLLMATPINNGTLSRFKRAEDAVRKAAPNAASLVLEYGEAFVSEVLSLAPERQNLRPYYDNVVEAVEKSRVYLRQFIELTTHVARFAEDERVWEKILTINEKLGGLMFRPPEVMNYHETDFDAFKVIAHECFLSTIAVALNEERFDWADMALRRGWLVKTSGSFNGPATSNFVVFNQHIATIDQKQQQLNPRPISLHSNLVKQAHPVGGTPTFEDVMQADFLLFLRSEKGNADGLWYPFTLVHRSDYRPFRIFARAESKAFFSRISRVLDVSSIEEFKTKITEIQNDEQNRSMFFHRGLAAVSFSNARHLGTID